MNEKVRPVAYRCSDLGDGMKRFTQIGEQETNYLTQDKLRLTESGYFGQPVERLALLENMIETLTAEQEALAVKMEQMRLDGKTKNYRFKELSAQKLLNSQVLSTLKKYGLMD